MQSGAPPEKYLTVAVFAVSPEGSLLMASVLIAFAAALLKGSLVDTAIRAASRTAFWVKWAL
jgi:hypothetical protein